MLGQDLIDKAESYLDNKMNNFTEIKNKKNKK